MDTQFKVTEQLAIKVSTVNDLEKVSAARYRIASSILCRLQLLNRHICRVSFLISHVFLNLIRHLYLDVEKGSH